MDFNFLAHVVVALAGALLSGYCGYFFSQKKYSYEKLFDRRLQYLEEVYSMIVLLEDEFKRYIATTGSMMEDKYTGQKFEEIPNLQNQFFELRKFSRKIEIVLADSTGKSIADLIEVSVRIIAKLKVSLRSSSQGDQDAANKLWEEAYAELEGPFKNAKELLKEEFTKVVHMGDHLS